LTPRERTLPSDDNDDNDDIDLRALRQALHHRPDLSNHEATTAACVENTLRSHDPDEVLTGLGGHGLIALWRGREVGPTVLLRAELDALPIPETLDLAYGSETAGTAHKCGHDGHMAMLLGLAPRLQRHRLARGTVGLLFQPAEETGEGAARMLVDPRLDALSPDWVFALHNLPGVPLGQVMIRDAVFASASTGLTAELTGATAHAAEPEQGLSPALAMAELVGRWTALPQTDAAPHEAALATVIHARLGEPAFGTTPGLATVMVTLRAHDQSVLDRFVHRAQEVAQAVCAASGLTCKTSLVEPFPATVNSPEANTQISGAAASLEMPVKVLPHPFPWSEDFGHFTARFRGAIFGLGAGESQPALHHPTYDFPDALLAPGTELLEALCRRLTSSV
jgi:amidohydrolase